MSLTGIPVGLVRDLQLQFPQTYVRLPLAQRHGALLCAPQMQMVLLELNQRLDYGADLELFLLVIPRIPQDQWQERSKMLLFFWVR